MTQDLKTSDGDLLEIAGRKFHSRLLLGSGKFSGTQQMSEAVRASGSEIVTVALRRIDTSATEPDMTDSLDTERVLILTNTSGAENAEQAIRLARLARAAGLPDWIKIEVIPDARYLLPDPLGTLEATEVLVNEGFTVFPYCGADPVLCKRLEEAGAATVMPLAAPIGSGQGLKMRSMLEIIIEQAGVPIVVDAGLGVPSHAAEAMELGASAVLVNTAIAAANDPVKMARAFALATTAGRDAYLAGRAPELSAAQASSPLAGTIF